MQALRNDSEHIPELVGGEIASCSVGEVCCPDDIALRVPEGRLNTIKRWLQRVPGRAFEDEFGAGPVAPGLLGLEKLNAVIRIYVARNAERLAASLRAVRDGAYRGFVLFKPCGFSAFALLPRNRRCFVGSPRLPRSLDVLMTPDVSIESHADHAVSMLATSDAKVNTLMSVSAKAYSPQVVLFFVKSHLKRASRKFAFGKILFDQLSGIHIPFSFGGVSAIVHMAAKNQYDKKMSDAYSRAGGAA